MATEKVAITVDPEVLSAVEKVRRETGESRSAVFNRAVRDLVRARAHDEKVRRYVEAYRAHPETHAEVKAAEASAIASLRQAPDWDDP